MIIRTTHRREWLNKNSQSSFVCSSFVSISISGSSLEFESKLKAPNRQEKELKNRISKTETLYYHVSVQYESNRNFCRMDDVWASLWSYPSVRPYYHWKNHPKSLRSSNKSCWVLKNCTFGGRAWLELLRPKMYRHSLCQMMQLAWLCWLPYLYLLTHSSCRTLHNITT